MNRKRAIPAASGALVVVVAIAIGVALLRAGSADGQALAVPSTANASDQPAQMSLPEQSGDPDDVNPADPTEVYDPVDAGEDLPAGYRPILPRDAIQPIYEPVFVDGSEIDWSPETLVIGITGLEEAKAYPVDHLNSREMVNDTLEGDPILVTW